MDTIERGALSGHEHDGKRRDIDVEKDGGHNAQGVDATGMATGCCIVYRNGKLTF